MTYIRNIYENNVYRTSVQSTLIRELGIRHAARTIEKLGAVFEDYGDMLSQALKVIYGYIYACLCVYNIDKLLLYI
jgi:hypothetical protein